MPARTTAAAPASKFRWYVASWKFWLWFVFIKLVMHWVEELSFVQRGTLGGFDAAMAVTSRPVAEHTAIVAITAEDVAQTFAGRRPVPPDSLLRVVRELGEMRPAVLVIDVFTDGPAYLNRPLAALAAPAVWAQSADTTAGTLVPVLGGRNDPGIRSGFAAMLAEEDGLVRRVRLRFSVEHPALGEMVTTLPYAAVQACPVEESDWCRLAHRLPSDTSSVALRSYEREPAFFTLSDVRAAASDTAGPSPLRDKVVVLGFADGSDQLATASGIRPGPQVVADAIETLIDPRGGIRRMPDWLAWTLDILAAIFVAAVQFALHSRPSLAAFFTLAATVAVYFVSWLLLIWLGYWVGVVPVMVGMWMEQLFEQVRGTSHPTSPPPWAAWIAGTWRRAVAKSDGH